MNFLSSFWIFGIILSAEFLPISLSGNIFEIRKPRRSISIGPCTWVIDRKCPDIDVRFYLFTRKNIRDRQLVHIDESKKKSNISSSFFNPLHPTKIIIHGYNSDMFLNPLIVMKDEYLQKDDYNLFFVDWSNLSPGPCYLSAVHNTRHTGACIGQLIERILEEGSANIHLIGFSLGAQVTNFVAQSVGSFIIPRISGLDPAMPLFITASNENKLDASDAAFVDIIHTNALVQGKIERCGHVDFYMNGAIIQPGCMSNHNNPFACSHHRAADYFAESIRSYKGFWGWACSSYVNYLLGLCPPTNYLVLAGEDCNLNTKGMYLISTDDQAPFAIGKWTDKGKKSSTILKNGADISSPFHKYNPLMKNIDQWGKLHSVFNNIEIFPTPFPQEPNAGNPPYFSYEVINDVTKSLIKHSETENGIKIFHDQRTPSAIIINRKKTPISLHKTESAEESNQVELDLELKNRQKFLSSYKENLSAGVIESEVFQFPVLQKH